ncbi:MAG: DUF2029 domain-containing protein [Planctomycetes bacterium]|nr:DUF2029 domain-containing protein [Planctomycetota bacterium]MCB9891268.1 DUF2029 domain-containing protein [Planctomycetota bacterium]MCB9919473.1 DUF2029 domain-containing protein [Planctomycetota bacterium]
MARRRKRLWLIALVAIVGIVIGLEGSLRKDTSELPIYTRAAARMLAGEPIYRPNEDKPFTYPPFFALPFVPLSRLHEQLARAIWFLANVAMLGLVLLLLARTVRPTLRATRRLGRGPPLWLFWTTVLVLAGRHVAAVFSNQSHDMVILTALTLLVIAAGRKREFESGSWAGFGAACKATPLLFLPLFVWERRWRAAVACGVVTAALLLLPDLVTPQKNGISWLQSWYDAFLSQVEPGQTAEATGAWGRWNILNQNLTGTIWRLSRAPHALSPMHFDVSIWSPSDTMLRIVSYAMQLFVVAIIAFACLPRWTQNVTTRERTLRRLGEASAIACGMVLLSPMSSKSHFCVLLLPATFCTLDLFYRRFDRALAALLVFALCTGTLATKGIWGTRLGNEILARGSVTWCAFALLLASAHVLFHRREHGLHTP